LAQERHRPAFFIAVAKSASGLALCEPSAEGDACCQGRLVRRWETLAIFSNVARIVLNDYLTNAYRVLMTRARQGRLIHIPEGELTDISRPASFYDETAEFPKYGPSFLWGG
jgi:hypothetical protein